MPKLAALTDEAEADLLAYMTFPTAHHAKFHLDNPPERPNSRFKCRTDVVGIFSNGVAITCLTAAHMLEHPDWGAPKDRLHDPGNHRTHSDDPAFFLPILAA